MKRFKQSLLIAVPFSMLSTATHEGWGFRDTALIVMASLIFVIVVGNVLEWLVWGGDHKETKENET